MRRSFAGEAEGFEAAYFMIMQDKRGRSSKFVLRLLNRVNPCSFAACSLIGSSEPLHADGKVPEESYNNFKAVLDRISGLRDLHLTKVVEIGQRHVLVPGHCIPASEWPVEELDDVTSATAFKANEEGFGPGTEVDRTSCGGAGGSSCASMAMFSASGPAASPSTYASRWCSGRSRCGT